MQFALELQTISFGEAGAAVKGQGQWFDANNVSGGADNVDWSGVGESSCVEACEAGLNICAFLGGGRWFLVGSRIGWGRNVHEINCCSSVVRVRASRAVECGVVRVVCCLRDPHIGRRGGVEGGGHLSDGEQ